MKVGQPSLTARGVALARSRLIRPQTPEGDPEAEQRLYAGLSSPLAGRGRGRWGSGGGGRHFMAARTAFLDEGTLRAVTSGVSQVVIVGAGYDGRALRFRHPGVRFFELDHPATQADKQRRLEALGVPLDNLTFVAIDLMSDRVDAALARAGQSGDVPSLFICEGLIRYLSRVAVDRMLTGLRSRAARGSRLLLTASESTGREIRVARQIGLAVIGEPMRSHFEVGEVARVLVRSGWSIDGERRRSETGGRQRLLIAALTAA